MSDFIKNATFYVYGLGKTGIASINLLKQYGANVFAYDDNLTADLIAGVKYESPLEINWQAIDYLLLSPGIQILKGHEHIVYKKAMENNVVVISDFDVLYKLIPTAKFLCITGTNGKSTTTALIGHIFKYCGIKSHVGGNIGIAVLGMPIEEDATYILEASSYNLELIKYMRFDQSCLTNLSPDHLDRHGNMAAYLEAKLKAFELQQGMQAKFYSLDYELTSGLGKRYPEALTISTQNKADFYAVARSIYDTKRKLVFDLTNYHYLPGEHNMENILFAYAMCVQYGLEPADIIAAIRTFMGLEHRIELVAEVGSLKFINDSKATNADACEKALKAFDDIIWIVGGVAKDGGISQLKPYAAKIKKAYLVGQSQADFASEIQTWDIPYELSGTIENALTDIKSKIDSGVVLLSPACASFDQFANFEQRGNVFKTLVAEIFDHEKR
jgi:UDP-N-acetylmuramoylalanine--D-glutamate ligase